MKNEEIKGVALLLKDYPKGEVAIYTSYLTKLATEKTRDGKLKNAWFNYFTPEQAASIYRKVAIDGLFIDGDTITLQFKGAVMVSYNYQAYKNKLLQIYPETLFDVQNVYQGDKFSFKKDSGRVLYTHEISNPFAVERKLIGCYCIIKNKRGEFIETLNETEIKKMKAVAKTQTIWELWYEEMTLKSVIKRACKRHFKDVTTNIDTLDNENNDLSQLTAPVVADSLLEKIKIELKSIADIEGLGTYFKENQNWNDNDEIIELFTARKAELRELEAA